MQNNKKGVGWLLGTFLVLGILVMATLLVYFAVPLLSGGFTKEQALQNVGQTCETDANCGGTLVCSSGVCKEAPSEVKTTGGHISTTFVAADKTQNTYTTVATTYNGWEVRPDGTRQRIGSSGSQLATTGTPLLQTSGQQYCFIAGNYSTYYGDETCFTPTQDGTQELPVYAINNRNLSITVYDENDAALAVNAYNTTAMGQNGQFTFTRWKIKNNQTTSAYRFWGFAVDAPTGNNVSFSADGYTKVDELGRMAQHGEYTFKRTAGSIMLTHGQSETIPNILLDLTGKTACPNTDEVFTVTLLDEGQYVDKNGQLAFGPEDDALNPNDVGSQDSSFVITCSGN